MESDFIVVTHGSIWTFEPITEAAKNFTETDLQVEGYQWLGKSFGVDSRQADALVTCLEEEGFNLEIS